MIFIECVCWARQWTCLIRAQVILISCGAGDNLTDTKPRTFRSSTQRHEDKIEVLQCGSIDPTYLGSRLSDSWVRGSVTIVEPRVSSRTVARHISPVGHLQVGTRVFCRAVQCHVLVIGHTHIAPPISSRAVQLHVTVVRTIRLLSYASIVPSAFTHLDVEVLFSLYVCSLG